MATLLRRNRNQIGSHTPRRLEHYGSVLLIFVLFFAFANLASAQTTIKIDDQSGHKEVLRVAPLLDTNCNYFLPADQKAVGVFTPVSTTQGFAKGDILYSGAIGNYLTRLAATSNGYVLTLASGLPSWAADVGSGGTVTSFSSGNLSPLFTTSVATATTTPALSFTLSNASANTVLAGPTTGSAAPPTYRSLVAADIPDISGSYVTTWSGGSTGLLPSTTSGAIFLSGVLNISNGGTGQTSANAALNAFLPSQTGNAGLFLKTDGANTSWASASSSGMTNPMTTLGDMIYSSDNSGTPARLVGGAVGSTLQFGYGGSLIPEWVLNLFDENQTGSIATGNTNNYSISENDAQVSASASGAVITGIVPGAGVDFVRITTFGSYDITLANNSTSSTAGNRFMLSSGADETFTAGSSKLFENHYNAAQTQKFWYEVASYPPVVPSGVGTVTSVATDATLTGGTITTSGTLGINLSNNNFWTAQQSVEIDGLGTSQQTGVEIYNSTLATSGVPVQVSPALTFGGNVWNPSGPVNDASLAEENLVPVSVSSPTSYLRWQFNPSGGGLAEEARLTSSGVFSAGTGFQINATAPTSGHYLRSDGTNFVDGTIQAGDLPTIPASSLSFGTGSTNQVLEGGTPSWGTLSGTAGVTGNGIGTPFTIDNYYTNVWHAAQDFYPDTYPADTWMDQVILGWPSGVLSDALHTAFYSAGIERQSHAWQTGGAPTDVEMDERDGLIPISAATVTTSNLTWQFRTASASYATELTLSNAGMLSIYGDQTNAGHILSSSTIGAATYDGVGVTAASVSGSDIAGTITITTAANAGGGSVTIAFGSTYTNAPVVVFCSANKNASSLAIADGGYVQSTATNFTIAWGTTIAEASVKLNYHVIRPN